MTYAGRDAYYRLSGEGLPKILAHVYRPEPAPLIDVGGRLHAAFPLSRLHAFDGADGRRIELHT